ncbi:TpHN family protein [Theileria parva strain Muguga]|uniref:Tash1 protein, putative n=1 Tax=Theileria parva TaxID=5875 RepID=Q4N862_THEPA|nr:uncharacterized protein TpMuguga_01g00608 [Theileria parva strain Muguga]EAN33846.1 TpHN family protein [Theileria parva strain Muguga]|eukprot:XP_766129.1 hypothetical protein [Theileria parva strain Muguga]
MVKLNILCLLVILILYHIKIVSSIVFDIKNISNSKVEVVRTVENGMTKTVIYSTPERKITEVRDGYKIIWMADPGEYLKCLNYYEFLWKKNILISVESNNPSKDMSFFYKRGENYPRIAGVNFVVKFEKNLYHSTKTPKKRKDDTKKGETDKKPKKRKAETDDTGEPEKKIRSQPNETTEPQQQPPLVPETIHFEISDSEDETIDQYEPLDLSQHFKKPTQPSHPFAPQSIHFEISSDDDEFDDDEEEPLDLSIHQEPLDLSIKPKPTETTTQQQLVPVTTTVEMESNKDTQIEESTEEHKKQQRKFLMESLKKKIQHRIEGKSKKLGPETIQFEVSSDEEESDISDKELLFSSSDTEDEPELISEQTPMIVISDSEDEQEPGKKGDLPDKEKS